MIKNPNENEKKEKSLKSRVEQNENAFMKVQVQMDQLESKLLNQMAEYGKEIIRIQEQVTTIRKETQQ